MALYLLKVHLQTFLSTPVTQKCQILSCDTLVANERYNVCVWRQLSLEVSKFQYFKAIQNEVTVCNKANMRQYNYNAKGQKNDVDCTRLT